METVAAKIARDSTLYHRNRLALSNWCYRMRAHVSGVVELDLRNEEQQDLGFDLEWRLLKRRYELKAGVERL